MIGSFIILISCHISIDPLPSTTQLTVISNIIVSISWNSSWDEYLITEYSRRDEFIRNWTTSNGLNVPYNLSNTTEKVMISICPIINLNFTVGKNII